MLRLLVPKRDRREDEMKLTDLFSLQGTLFAMMLIGAWLKKRGMIDDNGKRCLSDLCINVVIPCNIFKSCLIEFSSDIFKTCGLLPAVAFALGRALGLDPVSLGVSVLMTGMPAGATAAIFAARYDSDAPFATKCVVMSTLLSMLTLPMWSFLVGG